MMNSQIVVVTTFRQGNPQNPIERLRAKVYLDTAMRINCLGIPCVTLFTDTHEGYITFLRGLGVNPVEQESHGMGNIRREAIATACSLFPNATYYCWLEPEKSNLPMFIPSIVRIMYQQDSELGLFNRTCMVSYPTEQALTYLFCRTVASNLVTFDIDYAFGPMVMSKRAIQYVLDYSGEYGDKWEAILIPRLRIIKEGLGISIVPIDFENDSRMTAIESGNPTMVLKRLGQLNNIIPSLIKEWASLNKPP